VTSSALTGIHPLGGPIQKTLSPSELAQPAVVSRNGIITSGTQGQALEAAGVNPLTAMPEAAPAPTNSLTGQASPAGTATAPASPAFSPLTVGASDAQAAVAKGGGDALTADLARERSFQQDVTPLAKAIPALEALGTTGTGPGQEQINEIQSFLQSIGVPVVDAEKVKNFDEARKYLTQFAQTNGDTGTNDKLAAAFAGNPSVGVSNAAAIDVAKTALALRRMQNAQVNSFSGTPDQYLKYASQFAKSSDPRAYGFDLMSPEQRAKLVQGLSQAEKTKFVQSLRTAVQLGLVTPPNG
jgi:hypothetical protein